MIKNDAIEFLSKYQPLPNDDNLTREIITKFDEVRKFFLEKKDVDCIPLFLNAFGDGSGLGVYQLIENVIIQFEKSDVLPHLKIALESTHRGIKYWCAQIAASFPDNSLIQPLSKLLLENDVDIRIMASIALGAIGGEKVREILSNARETEEDSDVIEAIDDSLEQ